MSGCSRNNKLLLAPSRRLRSSSANKYALLELILTAAAAAAAASVSFKLHQHQRRRSRLRLPLAVQSRPTPVDAPVLGQLHSNLSSDCDDVDEGSFPAPLLVGSATADGLAFGLANYADADDLLPATPVPSWRRNKWRGQFTPLDDGLAGSCCCRCAATAAAAAATAEERPIRRVSIQWLQSSLRSHREALSWQGDAGGCSEPRSSDAQKRGRVGETGGLTERKREA